MIRAIKNSDYKTVMDIYNYYVKNSYYTFSNQMMSGDDSKTLVKYGVKIAGAVISINNKIVGFGIAYPFRSEETFNSAIKLTYFLAPACVNMGLGIKLYTNLYNKLKMKGYKNMIVNISSLNKPSIKFHKKLGFKKCGMFREIGLLNKQNISIIWMQKKI